MRSKILFATLTFTICLAAIAGAKILGGTNTPYELDHIIIRQAVRVELCNTSHIDEGGLGWAFYKNEAPDISTLFCGLKRDEAVLGEVTLFLRDKRPTAQPQSFNDTAFLVLYHERLFRESGASFYYYTENVSDVFWSVLGGQVSSPRLKYRYSHPILRVDPRLPYGDEPSNESFWLLHNTPNGTFDFYLRMAGDSWKASSVKNRVANLTFNASEVLRSF